MDAAKSLANDFINNFVIGADQTRINNFVDDHISKIVVDKEPTDAFAWFLRYQIMCKSNRIEEAREALQRALSIEPNLLLCLF